MLCKRLIKAAQSDSKYHEWTELIDTGIYWFDFLNVLLQCYLVTATTVTAKLINLVIT